MRKQYNQNYVFELDFPENVKSIFFNGRTYSKEKFYIEKEKFLKKKSANILKMIK